MTTSSERAQQGANLTGVSLVSISASPDVEDVKVLDTVINDDFARNRADELDAEAAHYNRRAVQEELALGPGYYVDLLRDMATDRAMMAQRLRAGSEERPRDPARRRLQQSPSQFSDRPPRSTDRRPRHDPGR